MGGGGRALMSAATPRRRPAGGGAIDVVAWAMHSRAFVGAAGSAGRHVPSQTEGCSMPAFHPRARVMTAAVAAPAVLALGAGSSLGVAGVAAASPPPCVGSHLSARIVDWQGAVGSRIADVQLVNTSFSPCSIRNFPQVRLVNGHGTTLIGGPAASTTGAAHVLAALGFLKTEVEDSNYCGAAPTKPSTLEFVLPGSQGRVVAIPVSATDDTGVPPCFGTPGSAGHISMHAWHA